MIDLGRVSGLPVGVNADNTLKFNQPLEPVKPDVRTYGDMLPVLMDQDAKPPFQEMYYMYRDVHFKDHEAAIRKAGVTYDITVIPPGKIGREFNKTIGHYHATKPGTQIAYPEVYEVLHGHALFLLQKVDADSGKLITVIAMEARAGEKLVYPPNYGHIIVNIGSDVLVTSNWVGSGFKRLYDPIKEKKGMAYFVVSDPEKGYDFVPNPAYANHPEVRMLTSKFMHNFAIMGNHPMYLIGTTDLKSLEFLSEPDKYAVELSSITS